MGRFTKFLDLQDDRKQSIAQIRALSILFKIDPSVFIERRSHNRTTFWLITQLWVLCRMFLPTYPNWRVMWKA
ncbi:MAG TPA: hypothetical protein V6C65_18070, partial [Allocoleopsis sp.]